MRDDAMTDLQASRGDSETEGLCHDGFMTQTEGPRPWLSCIHEHSMIHELETVRVSCVHFILLSD
jgi:hypothetical protein